jgi:radical SAM enzyme (TIGR01210 family)
MCDLWKNTTDTTVPVGTIPGQIEWALERMPGIKHLKLYNSGSFFDPGAIPEKDYKRIASLVSGFESLIVESHPRLINEKCLNFRDMLKSDLHVALGLETVHREVLNKLNKQMTPEDFRRSIKFLTDHSILSRAFILLRPPYMSETGGVYWAERSIDYAFDSGVECCTVIPVRAGNGALDQLIEKGEFNQPDIRSLEAVLEYGIGLKLGRIFADTWDLGIFSSCEKCAETRKERLTAMNLSQEIISKVRCECGS